MATCKGCGLEPCTWARHGKKWRLIEPTGEPHRCEAYRKPKPIREPAHEVGPTTTGLQYRPSCGECPAMPWDSCRCYPGVAERINAEADARFERVMELAEQP